MEVEGWDLAPALSLRIALALKCAYIFCDFMSCTTFECKDITALETCKNSKEHSPIVFELIIRIIRNYREKIARYRIHGCEDAHRIFSLK